MARMTKGMNISGKESETSRGPYFKGGVSEEHLDLGRGKRGKRGRHISDIISNDKSALRQQTVSFPFPLPAVSSNGDSSRRDEFGRPNGIFAGNESAQVVGLW